MIKKFSAKVHLKKICEEDNYFMLVMTFTIAVGEECFVVEKMINLSDMMTSFPSCRSVEEWFGDFTLKELLPRLDIK